MCARRLGAWAFASALVFALTGTASAQPAPADAARTKEAEAALARAHQLGKSGDFEGACAAFEESARLSATAAALLNAGICREHRGDLVGALAAFEQALAASRHRADQQAAITPRLDALRPRIPSATVTRPPTPGTVVEIDAQEVAQFDAPLRLNPGEHRLRASAPGARPHTATFTLTAGQSLTLDVPELTAVAPTTLAPTPAAASPSTVDSSATPSDAAPSPRWQSPWVLGGAGLFAAGGAFAAWQFISMSQARSRKHDLSERYGCDIEGERSSAPSCDASVQSRIRDVYEEEEEPARQRALLGVAAGGVGAAVALIAWFAAPARDSAGPRARVEPRLELGRGTWTATVGGEW